MAGEKKMRVKLVKSIASCKQGHRATVRGLGLKWTNHTVDVIDTPATRGWSTRSVTWSRSPSLRHKGIRRCD